MQLPKTQSIIPLFLLAVLLFSRSTYCLSGGYQGFTVRREAFVEPGPNLPIFQIQENSPEFPTEEHAEIWRRLGVAFNDMLIMAGFACATFNPLETVYKRYFGEQGGSHPALVRSIICNIAGFDDPSTCNVLAVTQNAPHVSERYKKLTILAGKDSRLDQAADDDNVDLFATTYQLLPDQGIGDDEDAAIIQVYKRAFDYPTLEQIINDRTCNNLGTEDSGLMTSLGAHLFHELVHWHYMVRTASNQELYDQIIEQMLINDDPDDPDYLEEEEVDITIDYHPDRFPYIKPSDPNNGYGPRNAAQLVANNQGDSVRNTDNYRWYVVSKYWQWICRREFAKQDSEDKDDRMVPAGSNGQVPYPGEVNAPSRVRLLGKL